ncbi:sulfite exporter TauE/SafE family protein [Glycomyces albidus]|uniref:sulfite exporter TauE/SafE family protein n=1 Tax=Glycomyces albidus TaxID=2656774 RepID=UPI002AD1FC90|nr:sulfite exporter TauE/SafE family protein [Glycomyces albidus]
MTALPTEALAWAALALGALLVGFAKAGIAGTSSVAIVLFAAVMPAKESTGAMLLALIVGDLIAIRYYSRHVEWRILARLAPWAVLGVLAGAVVLDYADDAAVRPLIGAILLALVVLQLVLKYVRRDRDEPPDLPPLLRHGAAAATGTSAGAATMLANAAGPIMVLYLFLSGFSKLRFLGTMAWFFLAINLFKVPFSVGLGLIDRSTLLLTACLVPAVALGAVAGKAVVKRVEQRQFEIATLAMTAVGAALLMV